jgi:hypothetical protein
MRKGTYRADALREDLVELARMTPEEIARYCGQGRRRGRHYDRRQYDGGTGGYTSDQ